MVGDGHELDTFESCVRSPQSGLAAGIPVNIRRLRDIEVDL